MNNTVITPDRQATQTAGLNCSSALKLWQDNASKYTLSARDDVHEESVKNKSRLGETGASCHMPMSQ